MKYYYLNRIAMAVLVALLLFFGTRTFINIASQEHAPEKPGFEVAGQEEPHGKTAETGVLFWARTQLAAICFRG